MYGINLAYAWELEISHFLTYNKIVGAFPLTNNMHFRLYCSWKTFIYIYIYIYTCLLRTFDMV